MGIFTPRRFEGSVLATRTPESTDFHLAAPSQAATELTKSEHYCVVQLPSFPPLLQNGSALNGYTDGATSLALLVGEKTLNIWLYRSVDELPLYFEFPIENQLVLALLVAPSTPTAPDPGLVIVDCESGLVRYYESTQHAPALDLIASPHNRAHLGLRSGETATLANNVGAGIAVATLRGRVVLVRLRDGSGNAHLQVLELVTPGRWFLRPAQIVSVQRAGDAIAVLDALGVFRCVSANGATSHKLAPSLENADGVLGAVHGVVFCDMAPVSDALYAVLVRVDTAAGRSLVLATLRIDASGVLLQTTRQFPHADDPKLYVPQPSTAFVVAGLAVLMADLGGPLLRWTDAVRLLRNVHVLGSGSEGGPHAAVLVLTREYGVLRIERFRSAAENDPVAQLKLHVQQAVYYYTLAALDFDVGPDFPQDVVREAVVQILDELLALALPYLLYTTAGDSLAFRALAVRELIAYVGRNFDIMLPEMVEALEKIEMAQSVWLVAESSEAVRQALTVAARELAGDELAGDAARHFLRHRTKDILPVVTNMVKLLDGPVELLVAVLHDGMFSNEATFLRDVGPRRHWVFDSDLLMVAERIFCRVFALAASDSARARSVVKLAELLYFFVTGAIAYMKATNESQLDRYTRWHTTQKSKWVAAMVRHGLADDAVRIAEKYRDFESVAAVLDRHEHFLKLYGHEYAALLFEQLIKSGNTLELFGYAEYLQPFFDEGKYPGLAWVFYEQHDKFEDAFLLLFALSDRVTNQEARELSLSLAKLAAIQAKRTAVAAEAEEQLVAVRVQNQLYTKIVAFMEGRAELVTREYFCANLSIGDVGACFEQFMAQEPLANAELVDLLTLTNPRLVDGVFASALAVASLIASDMEFAEACEKIWLRLLKCDDWSRIKQTEGIDDETVRTRLRDTVLFQTLCKAPRPTVEVLRQLVRIKPEPMQLQGLNLVDWIDTACKEAHIALMI